MKSKYNYTSILLTSEADYTALYEDYLDFCADTGISPASKDSDEFYAWADDQVQLSNEDALKEIRMTKAYCTDLIITGTLGLWNGTKEIKPERVSSVFEAIRLCVKGCDSYTVTYDRGLIQIKACHHDGTNNFVVRPVDKRKKLPYLYAL